MNKKIDFKLTDHQKKIVDDILNGSEIQRDDSNIEKPVCTLISPHGDTSQVSMLTFRILRHYNLIKLKRRPHEDIEIWA